jgi:hypothetical protein
VSTGGEAPLGGFLEAAGRSLGDAQRRLAEGAEAAGLPTAIAIDEVELEVKATLEGSGEEVALRPVSSEEARAGAIAPAMLSTLRVRYVATAEDAAAAPSGRPRRTAEEVIDAAREREDVAALEEALGRLELEAAFIPDAGSWLVRATDPEGRVVRELVVPDGKS